MTDITDPQAVAAITHDLFTNILPSLFPARDDGEWREEELQVRVGVSWASDRKGYSSYSPITTSDGDDDARVALHVTVVEDDTALYRTGDSPALVHTNVSAPAIDITVEFDKESTAGRQLLAQARHTSIVRNAKRLEELDDQIARLQAERDRVANPE